MAVKILCGANDGTADRKRGAIIHIQEGATLDDIPLGRDCCPPTFFVLNFPDKMIKDLPKEWLEYGGHKSRVLLEADKLEKTTLDSLAVSDCVTVDLKDIEAVQKDQGTDWNVSEV